MPDAPTFLLCSYCLIYFNHPICQSHWLFLMLLFTISISNSFICHGIVLFPNVEGKFLYTFLIPSNICHYCESPVAYKFFI